MTTLFLKFPSELDHESKEYSSHLNIWHDTPLTSIKITPTERKITMPTLTNSTRPRSPSRRNILTQPLSYVHLLGSTKYTSDTFLTDRIRHHQKGGGIDRDMNRLAATAMATQERTHIAYAYAKSRGFV